MAENLEDKVKVVLDNLSPALQAHSGDLEFISWDNEKKQVRLALTGHCAGCAYSQMTLKNGIEQALKDEINPEITVINVNFE